MYALAWISPKYILSIGVFCYPFIRISNSEPKRLQKILCRVSRSIPALGTHVPRHSHTNAKRTVSASRSPRPSFPSDWLMVPPKGEPCGQNANQRARYYVKSVVIELDISCRADVNSRCNWCETKDDEIDGRGCSMVTSWCCHRGRFLGGNVEWFAGVAFGA